MKLIAAMITAGEESLEAAVASIRPHVDAVVAIVTREVSIGDDHERFAALFDEWRATTEHFPRGEDGEVAWEHADFGAARNSSFDLARSLGADALIWLDSDDIVIGAENLRPALAKFDRGARLRLLAKYEYAVDEHGAPLVEQWRERVVWADQPYSWVRPVHEHLAADDGRVDDVRLDVVTWRHARDHGTRTERNLRILEGYAARLGEAADADPWVRANFALELHRSSRFEEALPHFEAYAKISERRDECALACVFASNAALATCAYGPGADTVRKSALAWALRAREFEGQHGWREARFQEARVRFVIGAVAMGEDASDRAEMERCRDVLLEYLAQPPTVSPLAVNVQDRVLNAPELLRVVSELLRDWRGAVAACDLVLAVKDDAVTAFHRRRYAHLLERSEPGFRSSAKQGFDVVIATGASPEEWDPAILAEKGMGGSETAVVEVSKRLARDGHIVRVIANCPEIAVHDGVLWLPTMHLADVGEPDVAVAWRDASLLEACEGARLRFIWAHDLGIAGVTPERLALADRVMGVSAWHTEHLRKLYSLSQQRAFRTRNGLDLDRFAWADVKASQDEDGRISGTLTMRALPARDPHKAIWSSSPDRGLAVLLDLWPRIREQVPDATLDVFYGFDNVDKVLEATKDLNLAYVMARIRQQIATLPGVVHHGRVDQRTLARAMLGAGVLAYCTPWWETSCITTMEAQAAGMRIVTTDLAALSETVGDRGTLLAGDYLTPEYQEQFVTAVVDAMLVPGDEDRRRSQAYARQHFSWDGVASDWSAFWEKLFAEREGDELPEYVPDPEWAAMRNATMGESR